MTERTYEAHVQRLVPRTNSADKEVPKERERKSQEVQKHRQPEPRPKAVENQGNQRGIEPSAHHELSGLMRVASTMESRSHASRAFIRSAGLSGFITTSSVRPTAGFTTETPK